MTTQDRKYPAYSDTDKMPWGKYKDFLMQDVPASYLKWFYGELEDEGMDKCRYTEALLGTKIEEKIKLFNYIHNSMDRILDECRHGI